MPHGVGVAPTAIAKSSGRIMESGEEAIFFFHDNMYSDNKDMQQGYITRTAMDPSILGSASYS